MVIKRSSMFETNSSSTHSIVVPHNVSEDNYSLYDSFDHNYDFGRCELRIVDTWDEKLAYVYYVLSNAKDRYKYYLKHKDNCYGSMIRVTVDDIRRFKKCVISAYNDVKKHTKYHYSDSIDPTIIFSLIDYEDDLNKTYIVDVQDRYDIQDKDKTILYTYIDDKLYVVKTINKCDLDRELFDYELQYQFDDLDKDCVNIVCKPTLKEKRLILIDDKLSSYTNNHFTSYNDNVYVDHTESFKDNGFIEKLLLCDKEFIKRFIFNSNSYIALGGDEYHGFYIKKVGFEYDYGDSYDDDNEFFNRVKELEKDNDIWLKGC